MSAGAGPTAPAVAAHRGGAALWPENSLAAFRGALGLGVDLVELDVHQTRDGEVVVLHDPTLERTTTGRGAVGDLTWAQVAAATLKGAGGESVPRLADVLELLRPTPVGLLLEIKSDRTGTRYPGIEERVLERLRTARLLDRATIMAFDWATLERVRALAPTVRLTGLLSRRGAERIGGVPAAVGQLRALGAQDVGLEWTFLSAEAIQAARAGGLTVGVWTINDADELRRALAAGIDYVTTDRPDLALRLRGPRR